LVATGAGADAVPLRGRSLAAVDAADAFVAAAFFGGMLCGDAISMK